MASVVNIETIKRLYLPAALFVEKFFNAIVKLTKIDRNYLTKRSL